jgi:hypothetical protein
LSLKINLYGETYNVGLDYFLHESAACLEGAGAFGSGTYYNEFWLETEWIHTMGMQPIDSGPSDHDIIWDEEDIAEQIVRAYEYSEEEDFEDFCEDEGIRCTIM